MPVTCVTVMTHLGYDFYAALVAHPAVEMEVL
jgi:hypothetical protein